jgi:hypothetical protein
MEGGSRGGGANGGLGGGVHAWLVLLGLGLVREGEKNSDLRESEMDSDSYLVLHRGNTVSPSASPADH